MDKRVLFGALFHWSSFLHIGSHQYAKQFARHEYKVAYISKAISPFHFLFAKEKDVLKTKASIWYKGGEWVENGKIWTYVPLTLIPVHLKFLLTKSWFVRNNNKITIPNVKKILCKNHFEKVDILFLDEAEKYLLDLGVHKFSIYRIHDDIAHLRKYPALFEAHKEVIRNVDLIVSSSKKMESFAKEVGARRTLYLPNGVEFEYFYLSSDQIPLEYQWISSPRAIYVGSIGDWFDVELIEYVAKKLKNFSFILIGRPIISLSRLSNVQNIYLLGSRDYRLLPSYIKNADVGIIPWNSNKSWVKASHPNKLYMYMACGLPVVSTKWEELENINSPAYIASNKAEFLSYLEGALNDKNKNRRKYIEFARKNSWECRYKKLIKSVYSEGD